MRKIITGRISESGVLFYKRLRDGKLEWICQGCVHRRDEVCSDSCAAFGAPRLASIPQSTKVVLDLCFDTIEFDQLDDRRLLSPTEDV